MITLSCPIRGMKLGRCPVGDISQYFGGKLELFSFIPRDLSFLKFCSFTETFSFKQNSLFFHKFWVSVSSMLSTSFKKFKVFYTIIFLVPIFVMYSFLGLQVSPQILFHYKSMFSNISLFSPKGIISYFHISVPTAIYFTSFPVARFLSRQVRRITSFPISLITSRHNMNYIPKV